MLTLYKLINIGDREKKVVSDASIKNSPGTAKKD